MNIKEISKKSEIYSFFDVVLAHDYITQKGGAERVLIELFKAVRPNKIITAIYAPESSFEEFNKIAVKSTVLSKIGYFRRDSRLAFPFLALVWSLMRRVDADVVLCSSSGWAHALPISSKTRKIVYCHNPARWLYQTEDYLLDRPWYVRVVLRILRPMLIGWDQRAASSVDVYVANSTSVAARIRSAYGCDSKIIFPPISIDVLGELNAVPGIESGFFLTVGRSRGYKGVHALVEAFRDMPDYRLVVVGGGFIDNLPNNIICTGFVEESQLRWLYVNAIALVSVSKEDFGLTPIEANAFGTPALLLRAGGFLDSTQEGISGMFIDDLSVPSIRRAVESFPLSWDKVAIKNHASKFSRDRFYKEIRQVVFEES